MTNSNLSKIYVRILYGSGSSDDNSEASYTRELLFISLVPRMLTLTKV